VTRTRGYLLYFGFAFTALIFSLTYVYLFGNPRVSYDGWQYLASAKAIITNSLAENYFWVRQPGYPLFIALSSLISENLWFLFGAQVLCFILAYTYFIHECRRYFKRQSTQEYFALASINFAFLLVFIGGYFIIVTPQAITSAFLLILTGGVLRAWAFINSDSFDKAVEREKYNSIFLYLFFPLMSVLGFCLSSFIGILPIACLLLLLVLSVHSIHKKRDFRKIELLQINSKWLFLIILSSLAYLLAYTIWENFLTHALSDLRFNYENLQDPFWGQGVTSYFRNLYAEPTLLHYIPASFLALIMFIPNQGWNGITIQQSQNSHSQNGDIGFGLFSTNYGQCVSSPTEVLTVNQSFISNFLWRDTCSFTKIDLPLLLYPSIFLAWIALCSFWIWKLCSRRSAFTFVASAPILFFIGTYAVFGGGIDRYGSSAYPVISFLAIFSIYDSHTSKK
jgi:hypothetical protein